MNKVYRSVWNATTNTWAAAAETAKSRSKGSARVARTAVAALVLGGASMSGAFATEVDATEEEERTQATVSLRQVQSPGTTGMQSMGTQSIGTQSIGTAAALDDTLIKVNNLITPPVRAADAVGSGSIAIGPDASVGNSYGVAIGASAKAGAETGNTKSYATALGTGSVASGASSTGVGMSTKASADSTFAGGAYASATAAASTALGANTRATGNYSIAIGGALGSDANGGRGAFANGANSVAIGVVSEARGRNSVALGANSLADRDNTVSVGAVNNRDGNTFTRQIVNMAAGTQDTDAVNVSQLSPVVAALGGGATINPDGSVTGPTYTLANGGTQTTVDGALNALDGALTTANGNIARNTADITNIRNDMDSGSIGLVQQAAPGANLTVGKNTDGAAVDFAGTAGARKLINVADGAVSTISKEAINGSQLRTVSDSVASIIGPGTTVNPDGSISTPGFTVGDGHGGTTTVGTVGGAVANLNDRVTGNETSITDIRNEMSSGSIGLVQQAGAGANLTVGKNTDGAAVDLTNNAGEQRKLIGVADGAVSTISKEAINGSQLRTVSDSVASVIGSGSTVNPDGSISAPSFTVGDGHGGTTTVGTVGGAVANLNDRVTTNEGDITNIRNDMNSGSIGLVQQAGAGAELTVGKNTDGTVVNFAGTAGDRRLTGVANGTADNDAASIAQLRAMGLFDPNDGRALAAVVYDGIDLKNVTLGGTGGTYLNNVAPGLIAAGSMQAVNGSQLFDLDQKLEGYYSSLDGRVGAIEAGGADGGSGGGGKGPGDSSGSGTGSTQLGAGADASGSNSSAIGNGSTASGSNSSAVGQGSSASGSGGTAIGQGSSASGSSGTAIGQGSSATHNNSVALGAGSTTDRDNSVSVGSAGAERQITNVAAGTAPTDAVNVRQMNNAVYSARQDAMGGVAAAMAVAGLPQSSMPGRTFMAISGSTYGSEYGTAIGASYMTKDGKWVVKGAVNTSSRGEVGAVVGGGFYW
ncbi:ESPR-type extended signal peptide-containing protein [Ralstonia sp. ASV6]|uniref:ESPR-type extended signal peptide-containing protein n=2 Tax=Ralstonia TaxID=48736 RepID=UPI0018EDB11A|nr:ESPR-type extended signal peptide-containing protein [Ralstonia sp. ASV6]